MGNMFSSKSKGGTTVASAGDSMLKDNIKDHDDTWYGQHLAKLGKEGVPCTKIATNGKPYDRRIFIDARNFIVEIRGGRSGSTGILLDDLDAVRRGLSSPEFEQFCG